MNTKKTSRNIPEKIKREVRQRCGFGCVICGFPIYDYEHMKEWAIVQEHVADDITLLCPEHHREKTAGRLPVEMVKEANRNPYNIKHSHSNSMQLYYNGFSCNFFLGGNIFSMESQKNFPSFLTPLMVDGIPLLSFVLNNGQLLLNANIFDEDDNLILKIVNNNLVYSVGVWDIAFVGRALVIRQAPRKILIRIVFETPNKVLIDRARFLCNGVEILVYNDRLVIGKENNQFSGGEYKNIPIGIAIGEKINNIATGIRVEKVNRYVPKDAVTESLIELIADD